MENQVLKVILLGNSNVGKSCIISKYAKDDFNLSTMATVAAGFIEKKVPFANTSVILQLWDTAGQERFANLSKLFYRNSHAALVVYDLSDSESLFRVESWIKNFKDVVKGSDTEPPMILVGNKKDLKKSKKIDINIIENLKDKYKMDHFEISAKKGTGIDELFEYVAQKASQYITDYASKFAKPEVKKETLLVVKKQEKKGCCIDI